MLYQIYETQRALLAPFSEFASATAKLYSHPLSPFTHVPLSQRYAAGLDLMHRITKEYERPEFNIQTVDVAGVPVAVCNTAYLNEREMPYWKIAAVRETFLHSHPSTKLDPRIYDPAYDLQVTKKGPSIFFETGVANYFTKERVDTVIVTGCNTSGCIRGTALDSFSLRYRTLVPEDCVGDIEEQPHRDNLRDIGRRYVDVVDLAFCLDYLQSWARRNSR